MVSIENGIIPWYPMVPKSFFSKSMMFNVFKTLLQLIIPLFNQFLRLYGKYPNLKIEKTHFLKYQEKIGRNFVVNCSIMNWRFRWMRSTQWSFYRPSFEWYPKLPSFSFLSIFKSVTFFETHNFFHVWKGTLNGTQNFRNFYHQKVWTLNFLTHVLP